MSRGTADLRAREASQIDFSFTVSSVVLILLVGLLVRLVLATYPGFSNDIATFQAWSKDLATHWPWNFYNNEPFADWTPGYLYILWVLGLIDRLFTFDGGQFEYLLKLPPIAFDLASVYLLYRLLEGQSSTIRVGAALVYALHPALLIVGSVWSQVDSALAFFLLLTVYFLARGRIVLGTVVYVIGFLTKPQAVAALPVFALWIVRGEALQALADLPSLSDPLARLVQLVRALGNRLWRPAAAGLATAFLVVLPFFPSNPLGIFDQLKTATEVYPYSTFLAYNFWGILWARSGGFPSLPCDSNQFPKVQCIGDFSYLGMDFRIWGYLLFAISIMAILIVFWRAKSPGMLALATSVSVLAFFLFLTRMHERYLFPVLLPLLAACVLMRNRFLWASFAVLSLIHFLNLYHVYASYNPNSLGVDSIVEWTGKQGTVFWFSLITFLALPALLVFAALQRSGEREEPEPT